MNKITRDGWKELDGETLTISITEDGPGKFQVWGETGAEDLKLLAEWEE